MKKETVYKLVIGLLLGLNILQLAPSFISSKQPKGDFREKAIKIMDLTKVQEETFKRLATQHRDKMVALKKRQADLTATYFKKPNDSLLNILAEVKIEKITITEQHFSEIKSILRDDQLNKFEQFKEEAVKVILKKHRSKNKPAHPTKH